MGTWSSESKALMGHVRRLMSIGGLATGFTSLLSTTTMTTTSRNPFRNLIAISTPSPPPVPVVRQPEPEQPPPSIDAEDDDLPPPYTPTALPTRGEETVESGPRRPFLEPPSTSERPRTSGWTAPNSAGRSSSNSSSTPRRPSSAAASSSRTGGRSSNRDQDEPYARPSGPTPASRPPDRHQRQARSAPPPTSDFARDFYAVGPYEEPVAESSSSAYAHRNRPSEPAYAPPATRPPPQQSSSRYQPPRGPPPSSRRNNDDDDVPDDGKPTKRPITGHPYLRNGQTLVYPAGHECDKCEICCFSCHDRSLIFPPRSKHGI